MEPFGEVRDSRGVLGCLCVCVCVSVCVCVCVSVCLYMYPCEKRGFVENIFGHDIIQSVSEKSIQIGQ